MLWETWQVQNNAYLPTTTAPPVDFSSVLVPVGFGLIFVTIIAWPRTFKNFQTVYDEAVDRRIVLEERAGEILGTKVSLQIDKKGDYYWLDIDNNIVYD